MTSTPPIQEPSGKKKLSKKTKRIILIIIAALVFLCVIISIISTSTPSGKATATANAAATIAAIPTETPVPTETAIPTEVSRCVQASQIQFDNIQQGIKSVQDSNFIKSAWAVKSNDFENVWMVSAYVYGPSMEDGFGPGIWAMNGNPDEQGITLAVDGTADEFTQYPFGPDTDLEIDQFSDGAQEAKECAEKNK